MVGKTIMDKPDRKFEPINPEQPKIGGNKRQSFKVAGNGNKSQEPDPAEQAAVPPPLDQSPDFPVEPVQPATMLEKSGQESFGGKDYLEKKLKGRRPGDRYIRLTRPSIAPNQA
jgi:hypothetical protein